MNNDFQRSNKKSHLKVTLKDLKPTTKKRLIILTKLNNPKGSLRKIADNCSANYSYARRVWSEYCRNVVTNKGAALDPLGSLAPVLPFRIHGSGFWNQFEPHFYDCCPLPVSSNQNSQKVFSNIVVSCIIHKSGKILVFPHSEKWEEALRSWLVTWMEVGRVDLLLDSLIPLHGRHYCVNAPGVPTGFRLRIKKVGTFTSDRTPFRKGTMEYEVDPGFGRQLERLEKQQSKIISALRCLVDELHKLNKGGSCAQV